MLATCELPSIRRFAADAWESLEAGELFILSSPDTALAEQWRRAIISALGDISLKRGDNVPTVLPPLFGDCTDPLGALASFFQLDSDAAVWDLLDCVRREPICILNVYCTGSLSHGWKAFFEKVSRAYRFSGTEVRQRPILAVLVGCRDFPPIEMNVGIRVRALWNVIRWEEVRLLTDSMLPSNEDPLIRTWRVAVYSASSGGDPTVVDRLCRDLPDSIAEAIECSIGGSHSSLDSRNALTAPYVPDQRWTVPDAAVSSWAAGEISGVSLERGAIYDVGRLGQWQAHGYLRHAIWREQVSGLLPIIMEVGQLVNDAASHETTAARRCGTGSRNGSEPQHYLEPSEIIERIRAGRTHRISEALWNTLRLLKDIRNDLAHMRTVDYSLVKDLSVRHDRIRRRVTKDSL